MKKLLFITVVLVLVGSVVYGYRKHREMPVPHAPHSSIQYSIEKFLYQQHGPDVECKRMCAPEGFEGEVETELEVVPCGGHADDAVSCAKMGNQCGKEHRPGCAEHCRSQCCACCSI